MRAERRLTRSAKFQRLGANSVQRSKIARITLKFDKHGYTGENNIHIRKYENNHVEFLRRKLDDYFSTDDDFPNERRSGFPNSSVSNRFALLAACYPTSSFSLAIAKCAMRAYLVTRA